MTDEEQSILNFLQSSPQSFFARKEIARKAMGRKVYEENQNWANTPLDALLGQGQVEQNDGGQFRIYAVDV
jgi:hypothetical protein